MRFITDSLFQRSAFVALYHPLSQAARRALVVDALTNPPETTADPVAEDAAAPAEGASDDQSLLLSPSQLQTMDTPSKAVPAPDRNLVEDSLRRMVRGQNQKLVLTSLYLLHLLCVGLVAGNPSKTVDGENYFSPDLLSPLQMVRMLQCMHLLPRGALAPEDFVAEVTEESAQDPAALTVSTNGSSTDAPEKASGSPAKSSKNDRHKSSRNSKRLLAATNTYAHDPDLLSLPMFMHLSNRTLPADSSSPADRPLLSVTIDTLRQASSNSLTSVQVAAHTVYVVSNLVYEAFQHASASSSAADVNSGRGLLSWVLGEVRSAVQFAARTLSARTNGDLYSLPPGCRSL